MRRDGMESTTGDRTEKTLTRTVEDLYGRPVEYELPVHQLSYVVGGHRRELSRRG